MSIEKVPVVVFCYPHIEEPISLHDAHFPIMHHQHLGGSDVHISPAHVVNPEEFHDGKAS